MDALQYPQIDAMRMGVAYEFRIEVRGFSVRVRPISIFETVKIMQEVGSQLAAMPAGARSPLIEHVTLAKETLIKASTSDVGANDPQLTSMLLERMTPDEILDIYRQYLSGVDRVNPALENMPPAKMKEMVAELKKKDPSQVRASLIELSFFELVNLAQTLLIGD